MFVFNLNFTKSKIIKSAILFFIIIAISLLIVSVVKIIQEINNSKTNNTLSNCEIQNDVAIINSKNYTNVLKEVHDDLETYIGQKISFTGYIYRVMDINDNQFILARNMIVNNQNQTVVVGFLCEYENAYTLEDQTWVNITGTIKKGNYYGDIPILEINSLDVVQKPQDDLVYPPDDTFVPTSTIY